MRDGSAEIFLRNTMSSSESVRSPQLRETDFCLQRGRVNGYLNAVEFWHWNGCHLS